MASSAGLLGSVAAARGFERKAQKSIEMKEKSNMKRYEKR